MLFVTGAIAAVCEITTLFIYRDFTTKNSWEIHDMLSLHVWKHYAFMGKKLAVDKMMHFFWEILRKCVDNRHLVIVASHMVL